jgi:hypothetical protein
MCSNCIISAVLTPAVCDVSGCRACLCGDRSLWCGCIIGFYVRLRALICTYIGVMLSVVCFWIVCYEWCFVLLGVGVGSTVSVFAVKVFSWGTCVESGYILVFSNCYCTRKYVCDVLLYLRLQSV